MDNKEKRKIYKEKIDQKFQKTFIEKLTKSREVGMMVGAKAITGVVYEKAKDETKTDTEKIQDIIKFCETSLGVAEKYYKENKIITSKEKEDNVKMG